MSVIPVSARTALLSGQIDVTDGTLSAVLVGDGYTFSAAHDTLSDVPSGNRTAIALVDDVTVDAGEVYGTILFTSVPAGPDCIAVWFFADTGDTSTSRLLAYEDRYADFRPIASDPIVPNGGNIALAWPSNRLFGIGTPT